MEEIQHEKPVDSIEFTASNGLRGRINGSPSPTACENFVRILLDIKAKYDIK